MRHVEDGIKAVVSTKLEIELECLSGYLLRYNLPIPRELRLGISPDIISFRLYFYHQISDLMITWARSSGFIFKLCLISLCVRFLKSLTCTRTRKYISHLHLRINSHYPHRLLIFGRSADDAFALSYINKVNQTSFG